MDLIRQTLDGLAPITGGHTHGHLTLYALETLSDPQTDTAGKAEAPAYLCLAEALDAGLVEIEEVSDAGSVSTLKAHNRSDQPVFLLDGEELVGAKQNRVTNVSILLPPHAATAIPVSCVEAGRWAHRTRSFSRANRTQYAAGRARRAASVSDALMTQNSYQADQGAVWDDISLMMRRMQVDSATSAMADMFERRAVDLDSYAGAFEPGPRQCGAVFAVGEHVVGLELFDHPATLAACLPAIVTGYALDALECATPRHVPSPDAASNLVEEVMQARYDVRDSSIGLGQDVRLVDSRLAGGALVHDERVVHLAAFRLERDDGEQEPGGRSEERARRMRLSERLRRFRD